MISRDQALQILETHVKNPKMIMHCLASEVVMRALARRLGQDEDMWGIAGLLHDIDVEITHADPNKHGTLVRELLSNYDVPKEVLEAISRHNEVSSVTPRQTMLDHALAAGETITGLIFATALVYPDKKISSVKPSSVVKRMKEKHFAASVKRENIMECELIGLSIQEFTEIALEAMKKEEYLFQLV
ncbi:MAG: HDIG domain-containing protein [Bacteroidales bacterium]|nr:HDIG domain-containing protein [Bacteroidales bacterium]